MVLPNCPRASKYLQKGLLIFYKASIIFLRPWKYLYKEYEYSHAFKIF